MGLYFACLCSSIYSFTVLYGAVSFFGCGLCYMGPLICVWEWFPRQKGRYGGLLNACCGFGAFFLTLIATWLVNKEDCKADIYDQTTHISYFDKQVADRVPHMFRTLALTYAAGGLVGVFLIHRKKPSARSES